MRVQTIREQLDTIIDPQFQQFTSRLLPTVAPEKILGVRLPLLRKMAARIAKGDWEEYLAAASDDTYEEIMLQGMVIGCLQQPPAVVLPLVAAFVPKIDNWSICDSFCSSLKIARRYPQQVWQFILPYLQDSREYCVRFAVVMLLNYYNDGEYAQRVLPLLEQIEHPSYYVKMAVAWAVSIRYFAAADETVAFLKNCHLDDFTYHKALQKIIESKQVSREEKEEIRRMRRK